MTPNDLVEVGEKVPQYAWLAFPLTEVTDKDITWAKSIIIVNKK